MNEPGFPISRLRRLRRTTSLRSLFEETRLDPRDFIAPLFLVEGKSRPQPIESMPGHFRWSIDTVSKEVDVILEAGVNAVLLFGTSSKKDEVGALAADEEGLVPKTIRMLKKNYPELVVITDVCLCAYTTQGHCGPLDKAGNVDNDAALPVLAATALAHVKAGADIVAPSAMMDGQVLAIRDILDEEGFKNTLIMAYSSKFASAMYGPFRDAAASDPSEGNRKRYQESPSNTREALRESLHDEAEGADILMIKPALFYLDIIAKVRAASNLPIAAYNVSGEYSMAHAMERQGWGAKEDIARESLIAIKRAGADLIISYWATELYKWK